MNNSFVTYLPCLVERGIDQKALADAGLGHVDGKWVKHTDLTGMEADFKILSTYVWERLPPSVPARSWMFQSLPKTVEETKTNTNILKSLVGVGCRENFHSFFALLGHGRSNNGALVVLEKYKNSSISPDDVAAWITDSNASKDAVVCILVDSCHSGHWVRRFAGQAWVASLVVQSSCDHDEDASGGAFTPIWMHLQGLAPEGTNALLQGFYAWKDTLKADAQLIEQHPQFYTNAIPSSTDPIVYVHGKWWIADALFFQYMCTTWDEKFLANRAQVAGADAIVLLKDLVQGRSFLKDFKLFDMKKPNEHNMSALFEAADGTMYILHVHYESNTASQLHIKDIITVFTTVHPVQKKSHADFSGWNAWRWGNETPDIYKEDRPRSTNPGKFLVQERLSQPLDKLLRDFVASETGDIHYFDTITNWTMMKGFNSKMRSRRFLAKLCHFDDDEES